MVAVLKDKKNLKYIYITTIFGCFVLWITVYTPALRSPPSLQDNYMSSSEEEDYKPVLKPKVIQSLCTPTTFNQGKWIYDPIKIESPSNQTQFAKAAGYHCMKKFAHRCFRKGGNEALRAKKM